MSDRKYAICIHGGAGVIDKTLDVAKQEEYLLGLDEALEIGRKILANGGTSLDAVEATVRSLENFPLFNAGRGSVFTKEGSHEMDAAIMDGSKLKCGAVGGINGVKNPVSLARKVMEQTSHVMLISEGAIQFGKAQGVEFAPPEYFYNERRYQQWQMSLKSDRIVGSEDSAFFGSTSTVKSKGTVGAVALDQHGNLAAATSTGGTTNKLAGRIGDSPIIGAGTYANNKTCAVSGTGVGEEFIRHVACHSVSSIMEYGKKSLQEACDQVVHGDMLKSDDGGLIAVDKDGNIAMPFNTLGMYRGMANWKGEKLLKIWE